MTFLFSSVSFVAHSTSGCFKGAGHLYRGENFQTKDKFCYVKMNSFLQQDFQRFFIKDFIINCNKTNYLDHYENLNYKTIGQQIYRNREQWVGNFDDRLIHHIQVPNSEEVKTFNLYESSNNPSQKVSISNLNLKTSYSLRNLIK